MPGLDDYGALLRSAQAAVPDYAEQKAREQLLMLQKRRLDAEIAEHDRQAAKEAAFQTDLHDVMLNPTADTYSKLILRHPEYAEKTKAAWSMIDGAKQQADLTQMGEIYSSAANGRYDLAAANLKRRIDADKAADGQADPQDEAMLAALESNDPVQQKAALGMIGLHLATITGPDKFSATLGTLTKGQEGFTLGPGAKRFDAEGNVIASAPFAPREVKVGEGETVYEYQPGGGDPASGEAGADELPPPQAEVASTLSSAGMPSHVVAGFLGNFHAEGGYGGAKGDGGSAQGIAQWRGERAANFQKVIGKSVAEATPAEQAQFVTWEMQHPEEAGMTVEQRDAILNAKTAPQAAALIDQFYERSSGEHRQKRMAAAASYADGAAPAAGGPRVLVQGPKKQPEYRLMTPDENTAQGLDPNVRYQINTKTGQVTAVGGQEKSQGQLKPIPQSPKQAILTNRSTLREVERALVLAQQNPGAFGLIAGHTPNWILQRTDPKGVEARAAVGKIGGKIIHDVSGAAVTLSESPRFKPYVPEASDTPETIAKKLSQLRTLAAADTADLETAWGPENGYTGIKLPGQKAASGPVKVRSIQEAQKLPAGTLFIAPNGKTYRKK